MKITIDGKEIKVTDPRKNIVEIADENGISIAAPCFRNKRKQGCCKACVIEVKGTKKYACCTRPYDGMEIVYNREDLASIRKERIKEYTLAIKTNKTGGDKCCTDTPHQLDTSSCCCSDSSCCS